MKKEIVTYYVCEMCGDRYKNLEDAANCEASHVLLMEGNPIIRAVYLRPSEYAYPEAAIYPDKLYVAAQDGETLIYAFSEVKEADA